MRFSALAAALTAVLAASIVTASPAPAPAPCQTCEQCARFGLCTRDLTLAQRDGIAAGLYGKRDLGFEDVEEREPKPCTTCEQCFCFGICSRDLTEIQLRETIAGVHAAACRK